jgi:hypothetical protein
MKILMSPFGARLRQSAAGVLPKRNTRAGDAKTPRLAGTNPRLRAFMRPTRSRLWPALCASAVLAARCVLHRL